MKFDSTHAAAAALLVALCMAAGAQAPASEQESEQKTVRFVATVNGAPFACGRSYDGIGTSGSRITPTDLRLFVSALELIDETGAAVPLALEQDGAWQYEDVALLDFEDQTGPCANGTPGTHTAVVGYLPAWRRYVGLRFTLGVPFALNHADAGTATAPLNITGMFWNWQNGHRFLKLEMTTSGLNPAARGPGRPGGFPVHLGSTACSSATPTSAPTVCANPNRAAIAFERFDIEHDVVEFDIGALLAGANVDQNHPGTSAGCMSFPKDGDCPSVMAALGLPYDGRAAGAQTAFKRRVGP